MRKAVPLILIILLLVGNVIYWGSQKEGFHIDEMFSYEQVGNTEYPKPEYDRPDEPCFNTWHNRDYYEDYLTISEDEAYNIVGFYHSASNNTVHPPLYLTLFGMFISVFFQGVFTKWSGIAFNIVFYVLFLLVAYDLFKRISKNNKLALLFVAMSGICTGIVSVAIFIRAYMMLLFECMSFLDLHIAMIGEKQICNSHRLKELKKYFLLTACFIIGSMTHYYFIVFAFFACLLYVLYLILTSELRQMLKYCFSMLVSLILYLTIWPSVFRDLLTSDQGVLAAEALKNNEGSYVSKISYYCNLIDDFLLGGYGNIILCGILVLCIALTIKLYSPKLYNSDGMHILIIYNRKLHEETNKERCALKVDISIVQFIYISLMTFGYLLTISRIAPQMSSNVIKYMELRYIIPVFPLICLQFLWLIEKIVFRVCKSSLCKMVCCIILLFFVVLSYLFPGVIFLHKGATQQLQYLDSHLLERAFYVTDTAYSCSSLNEYFTRHSSVAQIRPNDLYIISDLFNNSKDKELFIYIDNRQTDQQAILDSIGTILNAEKCNYLFETVGVFRANVYVMKL